MKKLAVILLTVSIMTSLVACGEDKTSKNVKPTSTVLTENADLSEKKDENTESSDLLGNIDANIPTTDNEEGTEDAGTTDENDNSDEVSNPAETTKPVETTKPTETAKPGNDNTPVDKINPGNNTKPTETAKPDHKHSYKVKRTKGEDCGIALITTYTCECGDVRIEKLEQKNYHPWGNWVIIKEADSENDGLQQRTCKKCSYTVTDIIEKPRYYDLSRVVDSKLTIEDVAYNAAEYVASGASLSPGNEVQVNLDCYENMDFFGYDFVGEELGGPYWGLVTLHADYVDGKQEITNASIDNNIPFKTQEEVFENAKRDFNKIADLLKDNSDIVRYVYVLVSDRHGNQYEIGLDHITEDDLRRATDGTGSCEIYIGTADQYFTDKEGRQFSINFHIDCSYPRMYRAILHISYIK